MRRADNRRLRHRKAPPGYYRSGAFHKSKKQLVYLIRSVRPTRSTAVPPFSRRIWACETPYLSAMSDSVSPLRILCYTMRRACVGLAALLLRLLPLLPPLLLLAPGTLPPRYFSDLL